jgi:hypothetical protein
MNPQKHILMLSNLLGKLTLGSILVVGWRGIRERVDEGPSSTSKRFVIGGESILKLHRHSSFKLM